MATLTSLPLELHHLIFSALQSTTSGPRYVLYPPRIDGDQGLNINEPQRAENTRSYWKLADPGPLYLAATCHKLREISLSQGVAGNLILEIPQPPEHVECNSCLCHGGAKYETGDLEEHLKRVKVANKGKRLTRFVLDSKVRPKFYDQLNRSMWEEILGSVSRIFGDELMVVVCCQGERVLEDIRPYAPRNIRGLEAMDRSLRTESTPFKDLEKEPCTIESAPSIMQRTLRNGRTVAPPPPAPIPQPSAEDLSKISPLSLHLYFGYGEHQADILMGIALSVFGNKKLKSLYFSSDPNNFCICVHLRRPAEGQELYKIKNQFNLGNPWRFLLPSLTAAHETLESITLDCTLFWSELAYCIPHLHQLKKLDCGLVLLHTEPMWPYQLHGKEQAGSRILETCLNSEETHKKERSLKKNKNKKWIGIQREGIVLPRIEAEVKTQPFDAGRYARFSSVDIKNCLQVMRRRVARSKMD